MVSDPVFLCKKIFLKYGHHQNAKINFTLIEDRNATLPIPNLVITNI